MDTNLPMPLTSFIGRERELADIRHLLSAARLITLTGPGGVGKTSLALQVARELRDTFASGAHFISLAAITDLTLVIPTLAQALGVAESPDRLLFDSLKDFLRDRQMLLVLDNFEQVISAASLLTELLAACAGLRLLVTSRETLRLQGEHEFSLRPLALSSLAEIPSPPSVETLLQYPGITLFVQRAQASQPEFKLTAENAAAVAEVCARLDGLPLAIELAAARIKLLPPQAMLARLQESALGLLTGGARDLPARQQTLRGTVQWSYDLLSADEQRTFRTLSVFVGGCTLEAATHVIGDNAQFVLERVTALINKSLLRQTDGDGEPRLGMLETIRAFGLEQLAQQNELKAVQRAHAQTYLALAEATETHLAGREQKTWLNRLGSEQDNLRAALSWGIEQQAAEYVLRLAGALGQFWALRGQWGEGRRWLEGALSLASKAEVNTALQAKTLYAAATLMRYQYDFAPARIRCEQSVRLYQALGDREGLLTALLQLGRILDFQGDGEAIRALVPEALTLAEALPDQPIKAQVYAELPLIGLGHMGSGTAARNLAESERIYRALDDPAGLATTLSVQAALADLQGDSPRAQALRDAAERLAVEVGDQHLRIRFMSGRLVFAWQRGDDASARQYFEQLLATTREVDPSTGLKRLILTVGGNLTLEVLAAVLHRQGLSAWAARVYGLADQLSKASAATRFGSELFDPVRQRAATARAEVCARLGDEAFAQALVEGQSMTVDDLLAIPQPPPQALPSRAQPVPDSVLLEPLTARELDVLRLLAQDLSNPQIAERLVVSRRTVEAHLRSIYGKFGVKSREAAIHYAREHGLVEK